MQELLDKYTGEIVKRQFASNRYIPLPDYSKNDKPSMTAPDQVEPLQVVVARCMRGEMIEQRQVYYESDYAKGELNGDETEAPGFDIADVSDVLESAGNAGMTSGSPDVAKPSSEDDKSEVKPEAQASSEVKE